MSKPEPPKIEDIQDWLQAIAQHERGERFLNCVLQRLAARVNQLPLPELAMIVHIRGDAKIAFAPNREQLEREFELANVADLAKPAILQRCLRVDDAAFRAFRAEVELRLRTLLSNAVHGCTIAL